MASGKTKKFKPELFFNSDTFCALLYLFIFFSICASVRIIYLVLRIKRRQRTSSNYLVLQLSAIKLGYLAFALVLEESKVQGPIQCRLLGFFGVALLYGFATSMMAIIYEKGTGSERKNQHHLTAKQFFVFIWILPMFEGILEMFAHFSPQEQEAHTKNGSISYGNCIFVPLFGSDVATLGNEVFRFLIFHLMVTFYMVVVYFKIRLKLLFLRKTWTARNEIIKRNIQCLRYILVNLIIFVLFWLPIGFFNLALRLVSFNVNQSEHSQQDWLLDILRKNYNFLKTSIDLSTLVFFLSNPIVNLLYLDMKGNLKICACNTDGFSLSDGNTPPEYQTEENIYQMGRLETVQSTGELSNSQGSTSDMEATPAKLVCVQAMVHSQPENDLEIERKF